MISGNENGKKEMIVLLIFLLICSGLGIAAFTMSLMKKCSEGFAKGEYNPTTLLNGSDCHYGKSCKSESCTGMPGSCKCVPKDHLGEEGDYCNRNYQCKSGMCDAIGDMPTNKCLPEAKCGPRSPPCEHGKCSNNKCILLDDGKNCEKASQCMSGICSKWNNQNNQCIPGLPSDYCEVDDDCKSADQCGQYAPATCIKDPENPESGSKVCTDWTLNSPCSTDESHPPNSAGGIYTDCPNVLGQSGLRGQCKNNMCQLRPN